MLKLLQIFKKKDVFASYQKEVDLSIKKAQKKIKQEKNKKFPSLKDNPIEQIKIEIAKHLEKLFKAPNGIKKEITIELPPNHISADLTISGFNLSKSIKSNPIIIAEKIAESINSNGSPIIERAEAINGHVNLTLKQNNFYPKILKEINEQTGDFGSSDINAGKIAIVDYSSPNVAKPLGIGHMRSTIIGQALKNIYEKTGYTVIGDNYIGDWGIQFGKLIYAYQNWGNDKKIDENPLSELKNLYARFHEEQEKNPELEDMAKKTFNELESGNQQWLALLKRFRNLTIQSIKETYKRLGIEFDIWTGESYFANQTKEIIDECLKKGLGRKEPETSAIIADTIKDIPSFLLLRQDGSSLYQTRDLATLKFRIKTFTPDDILYVVGSEQELHFRQIFAIAKALGWIDKINAKHISFGLILSDGKKMATRDGKSIELNNLIDEAVSKSREIIKQKNPNLTEKEIAEISDILGIGAIVYNDLRQSRQKNISFDWNKMLNFEGGSSAYLQYVYVRIQSILKKIKRVSGILKNIIFENPIEFSLVKKLSFFPYIIIEAQKHDSPHLIATYLEELAQLFNNFYNEVRIIETQNQDLLNSRIMLITSVALVIKNGLSLLNIKVPEKM